MCSKQLSAPTRPCVVRFARVVQRAGLTVHEIGEVLDSIPENPTPGQWQRVTDYLIEEVERRLVELHEILADLKSDTKICDLPPSQLR